MHVYSVQIKSPIGPLLDGLSDGLLVPGGDAYSESKGIWQPYSEEADAAIEEGYNELLDVAKKSLEARSSTKG